ncbi:hypothetical protein ACET3Z_024657 [Daucus carota]
MYAANTRAPKFSLLTNELSLSKNIQRLSVAGIHRWISSSDFDSVDISRTPGDLEQRGRVLSALATFTILQEPLRISPDSGNHPLSHLMGSVCGMRDVQMMAVNGGLTETCGLSGIGYPDEMKDGWFDSGCFWCCKGPLRRPQIQARHGSGESFRAVSPGLTYDQLCIGDLLLSRE